MKEVTFTGIIEKSKENQEELSENSSWWEHVRKLCYSYSSVSNAGRFPSGVTIESTTDDSSINSSSILLCTAISAATICASANEGIGPSAVSIVWICFSIIIMILENKKVFVLYTIEISCQIFFLRSHSFLRKVCFFSSFSIMSHDSESEIARIGSSSSVGVFLVFFFVSDRRFNEKMLHFANDDSLRIIF